MLNDVKGPVSFEEGGRRRICIVATIPMPLNVFMRPHIYELARRYEITLVANGNSDDVSSLLGDNVTFRKIEIERKISVLRDLRALYALWKLFKRERYDCVHSIMPKSGLLSMLAACIAGVPVRIHCFTGQVWATRKGFARRMMKLMDKVMASCATHLLTDSNSQKEYLVDQEVVSSERLTVLCDGSVCGVDTVRFMPSVARRASIRQKYSIPDDAIVALYLGRLSREKGVNELASAFYMASRQCSNLHLLVVGPDEESMRDGVLRAPGHVRERLHFENYTDEPEFYMAAADFFLMPSHREGFGLTIVEAAACGIPSIGSRIYGLTDAIIDGETGVLVPVGDSSALARAMVRLADDSDFRTSLGTKAMRRVLERYQSKRLAEGMGEYYDDIFEYMQ